MISSKWCQRYFKYCNISWSALQGTSFLDYHWKGRNFEQRRNGANWYAHGSLEDNSIEQPDHGKTEMSESTESTSTESTESSRPTKRAKTSENTKTKVTRFSKLLGEIFINDSNALPPRLAISERVKWELSLYRAEQPADLDSDPLEWWKERKFAYPILTKLIQKKYSMVATSVPSERLFSTAGNIIHKKEVLYFWKMLTS